MSSPVAALSQVRARRSGERKDAPRHANALESGCSTESALPGSSWTVLFEPLVGAANPPMRTKPRNPALEFFAATDDCRVVANNWPEKMSTCATAGTSTSACRRSPVEAPCTT